MGTERPSKSMLKPSITSHSRAGSQALGTEKLLERHPEGPAPILPSSRIVGGMLPWTTAKQPRDGGLAGGGRSQGNLPLVVWTSLASPAFLSPHAPLPSSLPPKFSLFFPHTGPRPIVLSVWNTLSCFSSPFYSYRFFRFHLRCHFLQEVFPTLPCSNPVSRPPLYCRNLPLSPGPQPWL